MKKFLHTLFALSIVAAFAVSCQEEEYQPGEAEVDGCYGVYFPNQEESGYHVYDPTADAVVTLKAVRTNTSGNITVPLTVTASEEGIFEVGTLEFVDGQSESEVTITFDKAVIGTTYSLSLGVDDELYASKYKEGATYIDFSVLRVTWLDFYEPGTETPAVFTFYEGWWDEVHTGTMQYYEVDNVRYCTVTCNEGETAGIWGDTQNVTFDFIWYTTLKDGDNDMVEVQKQYFGFDYLDWSSKPESQATYPVYFYDQYNYWEVERGSTSMGSFLAWYNYYGGNYPVCYYDGNGGFFFNLRYYIPSLSGGFSSDAYECYALVSGFTRVDYSLALEAGYCSDGVVPVYVEAGADVATVKYACYEGSLTATAIESKATSIADGSETAASSFTDFENGGFGVTLETSGTYTLVAVALDGTDVAQGSASVAFEYVTAADAATDDYAVDIHLGIEDMSARYADAGYTDVNSIAYYIYGSDLTDVHMALVTTANYEANAAAYASAIQSSSYAVDASTLEEINSTGGYADFYTGLSANTSYTLIVWATNGKLDTVVTESRTTEGLPLELLGTGDYGYTQYFSGTDAGLSYYLNPNYENTYVISEWGYGVDFSFTYNSTTGEVNVPLQSTGYTHSTYGTLYVVEAATYFANSASISVTQKSSYDATSQKFTFYVVYVVSAGYFGTGGEETFTINTSEGTTTAASVMSLGEPNLQDFHPNAGKLIIPGSEVDYERDPQAVKLTVTEVTAPREKISPKERELEF